MSIPVLSVYDSEGNKIPIPAIRGERGEKGSKGDKGDRGETGKGMTVKGFYTSVSALSTAVASPEEGDIYGVGTAAPYNIYIWDGTNRRWVDNGTIQGAKGDTGQTGQQGEKGEKGDDGDDGLTVTGAVINSDGNLIITLSDGSSINAGNARGAKGDTGEKGDTGDTGSQGEKGDKGDKGDTGDAGTKPVKGTDYWTSQDKAELVSELMAQLAQGAEIGIVVVASPSAPSVPSESMIWVKSSQPAAGFRISSKQPAGTIENGMVWVREMYMPKAELELNGVSLSAAQCFQYINGTWVWQEASIYHNGWKDIGVYWFKAGAGYNGVVFGALSKNDSRIEIGTDKLYITPSGIISMQNTITAGEYKYLFVDCKGKPSVELYSGTDPISGYRQTYDSTLRNIYRFDISAVPSDYSIRVNSDSSRASEVYDLWLV